MRRLTIPAGRMRPPLRVRLRRLLPTFRKSTKVAFRIRIDNLPDGAGGRLWGLADLTYRLNRVRRNGWSDLPSITHEDSDRVTWEKRTNGKPFVVSSADRYRNGIGGATPAEKSRNLGIPLSQVINSVSEDPNRPGWTNVFVIKIDRSVFLCPIRFGSEKTTYNSMTARRTHRPSILQDRFSSWPHVNNGPSQRSLPVDVEIEYEIL